MYAKEHTKYHITGIGGKILTKKRDLKKRLRKRNYNGIKAGNLVIWQGMKYKVIALLKHGCLLLDNGVKPQAKECERIE